MIKYIAAPLIGALIGYCTNYIAVKMLFRPRYEKHLLGHRVPLTPGAIPKGKTRLAKAVGDVISGYLVTDRDIESRVLAGETENAVVSKVMTMLKTEIDEGFHKITYTEQEYESLVGKLDDIVTERLADGIREINISGIIREKGAQIISEQLSGSMLEMFLNPQLLDGILSGVAEDIDSYIEGHCHKFISPDVSVSMEKLRRDTVFNILTSTGMKESELDERIREMYRRSVSASVPQIISKLDIAGMVRMKIENMAVEDLEDMVMEVMKNELSTIVNLGALIGFVLGLINLMF